MKLNARDWPFDRILLVVSYLLLVSVVIFEAWWINREFDDAKSERCGLAYLEVEVTRLNGSTQNLDPLELDEFTTSLNELEGMVDDYCGGLRLP